MTRLKPLVFLAFLPFIASASIPSVALAHTIDLSFDAELGASDELTVDPSTQEPLHYRGDEEAPPQREFKVLEPDETREGAAHDLPYAVHVGLVLVPILPLARRTPRAAYGAFTARFLVSSALPRGPPPSNR